MWTLFDSFATLATTENVYTIASNLLKDSSVLKVCTKGKPSQDLSATVKDQIIVINFFQNQFAGDLALNVNYENLYATNEFCQILTNTFVLSETSTVSLQSILKYNVDKAAPYTKYYKLWAIIGSIVIFFFSCVPALIIINTYNAFVNKTLQMLLSLPNNIKEDCKKPLILESQHDGITNNTNTKCKESFLLKFILCHCCFLCYLLVGVVIK